MNIMSTRLTPGDLVQYNADQGPCKQTIGLPANPLINELPNIGSNWEKRLYDISAIDPSTGILTFIAFNNVDYNKWSKSTEEHIDYSREPVGRQTLDIGSRGLVVREVIIKYEGPIYGWEKIEDTVHALVLIGKEMFLLEPSDLQILQRSEDAQVSSW